MNQFNPPKQNLLEALRQDRNKGFWSNRLFPLESPEGRLKPQFVYALNKHADIMAKHFTQNFIDLSGGSLSPNRTAELCLYHREDGLHIRPLVVVLQEGFLVEVVEVPHVLPEAVKCTVPLRSLAVGLEWNISRSVYCHYSIKVLFAGIRLISRHLVNLKCLSRCFHQWSKLGSVGGLAWGSLNASDDVGLDPANKMGFYPSLLAPFLAVFMVKPSGIGGTGEARRVNGEVGLYRPQRAGALLNEAFQQGRQLRIFQVAEGTGEGRRLSDQPPSFRFPQVGHKASAGHGGIDLSGYAEHDISQRQPRSPEPVFWLFNAVAEVSEQSDKMLLLVGLGFVIGSPLLGAGHFDGLGVDSATVRLGLPLNDELNGVNVLARQLPFLKVGAGAKRLAVVKINYVASIARLGGNFPAQPVFLNPACVGYYQPSLYSLVHFNTPYYNPLFYAYYTIHCIVLSIVFMLTFKKFVCLSILTSPYIVWYNILMSDALNDIQARIALLQEKGWTLAALADELEVTPNAIEKWKAGDRYPRLEKPVVDALDQLLKRKRIPKKRRYTKVSRQQKVMSDAKAQS
jgi:hypothetical protein